MTIDTLPSVALLEIFDFYLIAYNSWHTLAHVCRRWRNIAFGSPHRLNLRITCSFGRPVRTALDIWPPFPIEITSYDNRRTRRNVDNIVAALEHKDRVCSISLWDVSSLDLEKILTAMQEPFLELTYLRLEWDCGMTRVSRGPDSFLGGSAPHLKNLTLNGIPVPFLGFQKVLLSADGLVELCLRNIPHSVYFSPEAIVTCLSVMTKLKTLELTFKSPRSRPVRESRRPPPRTRTLLPALTSMAFKGINEYLEDIVAQIDVPLLDKLTITYFHQLTLDTRQLSQFIGRAPKLEGHNDARVVFSEFNAWVTFLLPTQVEPTGEEEIKLGVSCRHPDLQLLSVTQLCTPPFPQTFIPAVEHLYIVESKFSPKPLWENSIQRSEWLRLLRPFTAVKDLYLSEKIVPLIAPALRELIGERITEALPALQCLFLEGLRTSGPVLGAIAPFIAAREQTTHSIVASNWDREEDDWWDGED